jgi:FkbM family methyltransferase
MIKEVFKRFIFRKFNVSFATSGEDILLRKLLSRHVKNKFYVDIGAYHPIRLSNTYFFYLRGWSGICVDANPVATRNFKKERPRDICVNKGLSDARGELKFYTLQNEFATMNTFNREILEKEGLTDKIKDVILVECITLADLLDQYLPSPSHKIDFLSLDVEGFDLKVLKGNDWSRHRPSVLCVESNKLIKLAEHDDVVSYLDSQGYELLGKTLTTHTLGNLIFMDRILYSNIEKSNDL